MSTRSLKPFLAGMAAGAGLLVALVMLLGSIPSYTLEGVDDQLKLHRIPLWEKAVTFYLRHRHLERMVAEAVQGETDPERRVLKLLEWTRKAVHPQPPGLPLVDDHISHIVLRRYGNESQLAEVFTALTTYAGYEGRWGWYTPPGASEAVVLSFVRSDRGWWVFDVRNGGWFETDSGHIATVADFRRPEALHRRGPAPGALRDTPYLTYFLNLDAVWKRSFSRAQGQTPWHRLLSGTGLASASAQGD